jgi:sugar transferase (PEP-CTERM system associated)
LIRLFNAYFPTRTIVLGVSEALLVTTAFMLATFLWLGILQANFVLVYENGLVKVALIVAVLIFCMYYFDLYDSIVLSNRREIATRMVQVLGTACIVLALLYHFYPQLGLNPSIFVTGLMLVAVLLFGWRRLFLLLNRSERMSERAVVLGGGPLVLSLANEIQSRPELGINLLGYVSHEPNPLAKIRQISGVDEISTKVKELGIARIIVAMADRRGRLPVEELLKLKTQGIQIQDGFDVFESVTGRVALESLRPSWLLFSSGFQASRFMLIYKRIFDIVWSLVALAIAAPVMLVVAVATRLDSPGPAIYHQKRIGKDGKTFTVYKFRSMFQGAGKIDVHAPAEQDDPRVTHVGRWLRRLRLDELPQLLNILAGDMSFIGPRPFVPDQEEELVKQIPFYSQRWTVKPGASGWAQVHRGYCATLEDNAEKLSYDLFYIKNISIGLDLLILFQTVKILLLGRGGR